MSFEILSGGAGIFGFDFSEKTSDLLILPVPFEATTSYGKGTAAGPRSAFRSSIQVDLIHEEYPGVWNKGIFYLRENPKIHSLNKTASAAARKFRRSQYRDRLALKKVNESSHLLNEFVRKESTKALKNGKAFGLLGGDHSSPYGSIVSHIEKYPEVGILHIDAHHDLRNSFEGFTYSHASIFYNVLRDTPLRKLVQVGIRDYSEEEKELATSESNRVAVFYDRELFEKKAEGKTWSSLCDEIIQQLPSEVYISFDIDGLDPQYCPTTGTPVPGGLSFREAEFLLSKILRSGKKILGFDLNEIGPEEWDGNVGARMLFHLCCLTLASRA